MSHIVTVLLLARDPPAFQSACSRLKLAAPFHGPAKSSVGEKSGCWNFNPLTHREGLFSRKGDLKMASPAVHRNA